jgi:hypothetical protein
LPSSSSLLSSSPPANEYEDDHDYDYAELAKNPIPDIPLRVHNSPDANLHFIAGSDVGVHGKSLPGGLEAGAQTAESFARKGKGGMITAGKVGKLRVKKCKTETRKSTSSKANNDSDSEENDDDSVGKKENQEKVREEDDSDGDDERGKVPQSMLPGMLNYNNKNQSPQIKSPFQIEKEFRKGPWSLVNNVTLKYLLSGVYRNNAEIIAGVKSTQKNFIRLKQEFYDAEEFLEDNPGFYYNLQTTPEFKYFADFHCRLQNTCVSEAAAERELKHGKRMVTKHSQSTLPGTVVLYIMASSRKRVNKKQKRKVSKNKVKDGE